MSDKENPFEKIRDRALAKKAAREGPEPADTG